MKLNKILVFSEAYEALPELCSGANLLAEETVAVVLGSKEAAEAVSGYAAKVLWMGEKAPGSMVEDYVPALAELVEQQKPDLILIRATRRGKCVAGRLAVKTGSGVCSGADAFEVTDAHTVILGRMVYGGAAAATAIS
jgi:electron transfer flavoprotein alpha subunit